MTEPGGLVVLVVPSTLAWAKRPHDERHSVQSDDGHRHAKSTHPAVSVSVFANSGSATPRDLEVGICCHVYHLIAVCWVRT